ncbi:MAG: hypothetical protein JWM19_6967 [Actinomycetia bacterium]|nr:hypothetical protein [Actinomycetes bacterium]
MLGIRHRVLAVVPAIAATIRKIKYDTALLLDSLGLKNPS